MAADGSVVIEIKGDADELLKAFKNVATAADQLGSAVEGIADSFRTAASAADSVDGGGLGEAATAADRLDSELDEAAQTAGQLDDSLDGVDGGGLGAAEKGAEDLGKDLDDAKADADKLGESLDDIGQKGSLLGDIFKGNLLANFATKGLEAAADAAAALVGTVKNVASSALDSYSAYQQLTGGVETLFGASSSTVMNYANNAYKTAGMSANAYMETVTSFSASLLQGLGGDTAEAARIADLAVTDMADNANKMGTSMQSIQDAYQGFAKQNYTMLDNLKLGYGGTQEEMIRLINDSGVLEQEISSLDGISFDTMISAIHAIQEQMGITGTTALEAGTTIEGSVNSVKASWENLLTGMADPDADLGALMENFSTSLTGALNNIIPQVITIFQNLGPVISGVLPTLFENSVGLVEAATSIIRGIADGLVAAAPILGEQAPAIIAALVQALIAAVGAALEVGVALIEAVITGVQNSVSALLGAAGDLVGQVIDVFRDEFSAVGGAIGDSLSEAADAINDWAQDITGRAVDAAAGFVSNIVSGLSGTASSVRDAISGAVESVATWGSEMKSKAQSKMQEVAQAIKEKLSSLPGELLEIGRNVVQGFINGISEKIQAAKNKATEFANSVKGIITGAFKTASPSKWALQIGKYVVEGFANGIVAGTRLAVRAMKSVADVTKTQITKLNDKIEAIEAAAQKRQADKELAEYQKNLKEKYTELEKAELSEREKIQEEIAKLEADWAEKQLQAQEKAQKEALQSQIDALEEVRDAYQDAMDEIVKARDSMSGKLSDFELFDNDDGDLYLWDIQKMIDQIQAYGDAMTALKDRGISDSLFQEIVAMDREEAILYAKKLLEMGDAQYDAYMNLWKQKEDAAQRVAETVYASEVEAINAEYSEKLPDVLGESAQDAMGSFSENLAEAGKGAVNTARNIADAVIAELERINAAQRLQAAVYSASGSFSGSLSRSANNAAEGQRAARRTAASETAAATAMTSIGNTSREIVLNINGKEAARALVDDIRAVEDQSPRITSD